MVLHFVIDGKLTDQFIDNFLQVSGRNYFLVFGTKGHNDFKRITRRGSFLSPYDENRDDINDIIRRLDVKAIILHSLFYDFAKVIVKIKKEITICWAAWGFDVYGLPRIEPQIYAPLTKKFLIRNTPGIVFKRFIQGNEFLRRNYFKIVKKKDDSIGIVYEAHKKIKFFLTYIKEDFEVFSQYYPNNFQFIYSTFSTIDQYLAGNNNMTIFPEAGNILLGNSNAPPSNYLDAIPVLASNISNLKKVYVVLSYGSNDSYKKKVIFTGRKLLKDHFHPLLDFLDRRDYIQLLQSCSVGIFNHYRQQAMGNIIAMLYMGSRIYLSSKNPVLNFFLRNGIIVYSFEEEFNKYGISRPDIEIVENNRLRLNTIFSKENVLTDLTNLTDVLTTN